MPWLFANLMNEFSCSADQYGVRENMGSQHVSLTPSLQWTLSPGNFLKEQVWTESWLNGRGSVCELGPEFVRKDKLKNYACSSHEDKLSHHHHSSLSSQLTWFQEICFINLLHKKKCLYQPTELSVHLFTLSFKKIFIEHLWNDNIILGLGAKTVNKT